MNQENKSSHRVDAKQLFRTLTGAAFALGTSLILVQPAQAASATWTGTASTGNWTDATWNSVGNVPPGTSGGTTSPDVATFATGFATGPTTTITVDSNRNVGGISFTGTTTTGSSSFTLTGGSLVLSSGGTILSSATAAENIETSITLEGNVSFISNAPNTSGYFLDFQSSSNTIAEASGVTGTLILSGSNNQANYVNSVIQNQNGAGSGMLSLTKTGVGVWNLEANDTYTGATVVAAGTLEIDTAAGELSGTSSVTVQGGANLFVGASGANAANNRLNTAAPMTLGGAYFSGAGTTSLNGTYTLLSTGTGSFANSQSLSSLTIAAGTSDLVTNSGTAAPTNVPVLTLSGATTPYIRNTVGFVDLNQSGNLTIDLTNTPTGAGNVGGGLLLGAYLNGTAFILAQSGALTSAESGAHYLTTATAGNTAANYLATSNVDVTSAPTLSGSISINSLRLGSGTTAEILTLTGTNQINSPGILEANSSASTITGGTIETASAGGELLVYLNSKNLTINSVIGDNGTSSLSVGDATGTAGGILILTGANTYAGVTSIASGATLQLGDGATVGTSLTGSVTNYLGGTFVLNLANGGSLASNITSDGVVKFTPGTGVTQTYSGSITDGGTGLSNLTQTTAGTTDLTGASSIGNLVNVGFAVSGGGIVNDSGGVISTGILNIGTGSTFNITGGTNSFNGSALFNLGFEGVGNLNISGGTSTFIGNDTANRTATVVNQTNGTVTINNSGNSYFGMTYTISGSSSSLTILGAMRQLGTVVVNGGTVLFNDDGVINGGRLSQGSESDALTINGGQVTWEGASLTVQYATGTFGGTVNLNGGTFTMDSVFSTTSVVGGTFNFNGGTLQAGLSSTTFQTASDKTVDDVQNGGAVIDTNGFSITFAHAIVHGTDTNLIDGGMTKNGTGTLTLSALNIYNGATTVNAGTLTAGIAQSGSAGAFGTNSAVVMANVAGATLNLANFNETIGSLTGGGTTGGNVTLGTATLTVGTDNTSPAAYAGVISGTGGSLTETGTGTLTLTGANTYTGVTTIGGTLQLGNGGTTGTLATGGTIVDNGIFAIDRSNAVAQGTDFSTSIISGTGGFLQEGTGTTTLNNTNSYSGNTTIAQGAISFNFGNTTSSMAQSLGEGSTVNLGVAGTSSGTLIYTGAAGTLAKNINVLGNGGDTIQNTGSGLLTLSGSIVKNGTVLTLKGGAQGINVTGVISGASSESDLVIDTGTTTLSNANTYNGPTYIRDGGTLNANVSGALPTGTLTDVTMDDTGTGSSTLALGASQDISSLTGASTSQVNLNANTLTVGNSGTGTATATFAGTIDGSGGSLVKNGTSTEVLSGSNTYSGGTTVSAGALQMTNGTTGSATGSGALSVGSSGTIGGIGTSASSSFSIAGNVVAGSGLTSDTTGQTVITGAAVLHNSNFTNATLSFNLDSASLNSTSVNVGATGVDFGNNTTLSLTLQGSTAILDKAYVLISGVNSSGLAGVDGSQYGGITTDASGADGLLAGQYKILTGLNLTFANDSSSYGADSFLFLNTVGGVDNIEVEVVPEPGTWAMLLGGFVLLIFIQRRRRE